jgi:hypothetical protein
MSLTSHARKLAAAVAAKDQSTLEELCRELEYEQLGKEQWPQEVFEFFVEALRDRDVAAMEGSASFITSLYNDFDKLTPVQHESLLKVLKENADEFGDEMLRHAASDLIARQYPVPVALRTFNDWMRAATPNRLHMAQVGFEVLVMAKRLEPAEEVKVRSQLEKLWRRD